MAQIRYYLPLLHKGQNSIYPFYRIGGYGLGNMLFPFFRALCFGIRDGASILYPLFNQIQPRNFLRDKTKNSLRNYNNVFKKFLWATLPSKTSSKIFYSNNWFEEEKILKANSICFLGCKNYFYDLINFRFLIQNFVKYSFDRKDQMNTDQVAFHIRLGDFLINKNAVSSEIILKKIIHFSQINEVQIYSDFNLRKLLEFLDISELPANVKLIRNFSPMQDIIDMSQSKYLVGNPKSTFVEWARFLSPNSYKQITYSLISKKEYDKNKISPLDWDYFL